MILTWFCKHKWVTHVKKKYEWEELNVQALLITKLEVVSQTIEVLICEKCGKIKIIEY